jgi:uncharacterized protein YciI
MDALFETGVIVLGGPFADGSGALVIVTADSADRAHALFRHDPWVERDVLAVAEVKEWTIFLDGRKQ